MYDFKVYYLINCGLMITYHDTCIMIDGLNGPSDYFDHIPDNVFQDILDDKGFFKKCDHLVYTHHHFDHFDADRTIRYMNEKNPESVFLPFNKRSFFNRFEKSALENGIELISPDFTTDDCGIIELPDFCIRYYSTGHIGKENADVPHYAIILELGDRKIFIAADSDYLNYERHAPFFDKNIDIAFYNPFYMSHHNGRRIIKAIGAPENYIYHLPFFKEDVAGIRHQLDRAIQKYSDEVEGLRIIPLKVPMEEVI